MSVFHGKRDNGDKFILQTTGGRLVLVDLDVKSNWSAVNLYWPNDKGKGMPHIWVGDDGGTEEEVEKVYGAFEFDCSPPLPAYVLYDKETFIRRVIAKRDKYYPESAKTTEEELINLREDDEQEVPR